MIVEPFEGIDAATDMALRNWVHRENAKLGEGCLVVGNVYRHPQNRKLLRVMSGEFIGGYGRISNHWHWDYLFEDHAPTGESGQGYGWHAKPIAEIVA